MPTRQRAASNARPLPSSSPDFPISAESKAQLIALYARRRDPLAGKSGEEKRAILKRTSYRDYLIKICGCSEEVANCFQGRTLGFFGLGATRCRRRMRAISAIRASPGSACRAAANAAWSEPYIYHFPDGNASLARLLVRALIPGVAPGGTMDDVVLAPFDYGKLDAAGQRGPHPARCDLRRRRATPATRSQLGLRPRRRAAPRRGARTRCSPAST